MSIFKKLYRNILGLSENFNDQKNEIQNLKLLIAQSLIKKNVLLNSIQEAEFKVFSQWGDDGIIQYLINHIDIKNKIFVEFGVENYTESNTRFLLMNNNWKGLVMDGSESHINFIKSDPIYWKYGLIAKKAFITAENINSLISEEGINGNIGLLHIDIDGNDYWIWDAINVIDADIVIVEYNSVFGDEKLITIPYQSNFIRNNSHFSNLYFGVSVAALCFLAEKKGYFFIGCNSAGNNAYFVKKEKIGKLTPLSAKEGYVESNFKESRDKDGKLNFKQGKDRLDVIKGLSVINVETNLEEKI
jgi:hypothetical protein